MASLSAVAVLAERLRDSARETLADFRRLGLPVEVLTGDTTDRAEALGLPATRGGMLPDDKRAAVEQREDRSSSATGSTTPRRWPRLTRASRWRAGPTSRSRAADVTLYHTDLRVIPWAIEVSREAVRAVRRNLYRALCYNLIGMTLAACGVLHPVVAALLMVVSSLSLIFSATRVGVMPDHCELAASRERERPEEASSGRSRSRLADTMLPARRSAWHGMALGLQGIVFLLLLDSLRELPVAPFILGTFALAGFALAYLWNRWATIPHALDMCFGMLTLGNLGMLLGWWADNGFVALHDGGCCRCVEAMRDGRHGSRGCGSGCWSSRTSAMLWLPRRPAARGRDHIIAMYTGGNIGMVLGMLAGGWCAAQFSTESMTAAVFASFAGMTAGMLAGMLLGTWLTEKLCGALRAARTLPGWLRTGVVPCAESTRLGTRDV